MKPLGMLGAMFLAAGLCSGAAAAEICEGFGPQTPRDIAEKAGKNPVVFTAAPQRDRLNLCNIHFHVQAEHKGPSFSVFAGPGEHGGYRCAEPATLSPAELADPQQGQGACRGVKPGDTIEVHWVHTSCSVQPGPGLGACLSGSCANPQLRVEAQVFLLVNDPKAANFADYDYEGLPTEGRHRAKALPGAADEAVLFLGSTTGPSYSEAVCSPLQVTWAVRPLCRKLDIGSLHAWCESNVFKEDYGHGVRQLVTTPELLAVIE